MRRVAKMGCHAITFPENPVPLGLPSLHTDHWDPVWQACSDEGTVVCMHIGSSGKLAITAPDAPIDVLINLQPMNIVQAAADVLFSPMITKFPDVTIALSEGGIGWIPYFLERIDHTYKVHKAWTFADFGGKLPSEVFMERMILCFIEDDFGARQAREIGTDRICIETDYPHSDAVWPNAPERMMEAFAPTDLTDHEINQMTHLNAMKFFQYDPFKIRPREKCTAGALRAEAVGHDISIVAKGRRVEHDAPTKVSVFGDVKPDASPRDRLHRAQPRSSGTTTPPTTRPRTASTSRSIRSRGAGSARPESELQVLGDVRGKDMLELGCGGGQWSIALEALGARPVGLDLSREQLRHARQASASVPLLVADAERLPFANDAFDIVFCDHGAMNFCDPARHAPGGRAGAARRAGCSRSARRPRCSTSRGTWRRARSHGACTTPTTTSASSTSTTAPSTGCSRPANGSGSCGANGFDVEDLIELRPAADATTTYDVRARRVGAPLARRVDLEGAPAGD